MTAARRILPSAAIALAGLGSLAACSGDADAESTTSASSGSSSGSSSSATGTWTEKGDYQTPGGTESVTVTLTVKSGTVTAVKVTGSGGTPNSRQYQEQFESGIAAEVVGTQLSTLEVGAVSGSSLTGSGFNAAVENIRGDAG